MEICVAVAVRGLELGRLATGDFCRGATSSRLTSRENVHSDADVKRLG